MTSATNPGEPSWYDLLRRAQQWADENAHERYPFTHDGGVTWEQMPLPWRWHRCWPQSWGSCGPIAMLQRCPCGGTRIDVGPWLHRNSRRINIEHGIGPTSGGENVGDYGIGLIRELRAALRERTDH